MKVLVTGGCGFLGSHICEYYCKQGAEVISYDVAANAEYMQADYIADEAKNYTQKYLHALGVMLINGDVRNFEALLDYAQGCDYIVHTAAQPSMTISGQDPRLDLTCNVIGTFNVLEVARKLKIPIASSTTIHVYGNEINKSLSEGERRYIRVPETIDEFYPILEGTLTPLHASKAASDIYIQVYLNTYNVEAASFRLSAIYGTRQFYRGDHGWVVDFVTSSLLDWPLTIYGTGKKVRDIIYVTDVCRAFDAFYQTRKSGIYNLGGGIKTALSLLECIDIIEEITGKTSIINFEPDRPGYLHYFICDTEKAQKNFSWQPIILPRQGIEHIFDWVTDNISLFKRNYQFY